MRKNLISFSLPLLLVAIDRISKAWALIAIRQHPVEVIPGLLSFRYAENSGAAFGMLSGMRLLNGLLTLTLLIVLFAFICHHRKHAGMWYSGLTVIGGGISHLYDRLLGKNIIDFIRLDFIDFPIFNFADICICVGTVLLALFYLKADSDSRREKA